MIRPMIATLLVACLSIAAQAQQRPATQDLEGWANVPGGTVWLRPGVDSYEHSTGLVRDMQTGQKHYPVTPQQASQAYVVQPPYAVQPYAQPAMQQPCQQQPCAPQVIVTPMPAPQSIMPQVVAPLLAPRYPQQPTRYLPNPYYSPSFTPQARPTRNSSRYDYGPYGEYADSGLEATPPASLSNQFGTLRRF